MKDNLRSIIHRTNDKKTDFYCVSKVHCILRNLFKACYLKKISANIVVLPSTQTHTITQQMIFSTYHQQKKKAHI